MAAIIYRLTNTVNHKTYIGLTTKTLDARWRTHCNSAVSGSSQHIHRAIRKYGTAVFLREILEETTVDAMQDREKQWIAELKPEYNKTVGGDGCLGYKHSEETRKLLKEKRNQRPPASPETRAKMSAARRGKPMPAGTGEKISRAQRGVSRPSPSIETRAKRSATMKALIEEKKRLGIYERKGGRPSRTTTSDDISQR